jgi:glycine betaine/choline ABC-type transport system substrate-binding protein/ABC-type proline/glycine betaine transport system permease subunit
VSSLTLKINFLFVIPAKARIQYLIMKFGFTILLFFLILNYSNSQTLQVGAKHFNEGYILSEIISQLLEDEGYSVSRNFSLGGTLICFDALKNDAIDIYPEYTGTINDEILKLDRRYNQQELNETLQQKFNLEISEPYGFNNTYALTVKKFAAEKYGLARISDLQSHPDIKMALSYEFLKRKDGWENLARTYNLKNTPVGIEHGLAYQALDDMKIDLTDAYSTDGEIVKYDLVTLEDDKNFFPKYFAVSFYHSGLDKKAKDKLNKLTSQINEHEMQSMNYKVLFEKKTFAEVASEFLRSKNLIRSETELKTSSVFADIVSKTLTHLKITFIALALALLIALPLGILIYLHSSIARPVLYFTGLLQTIPSIALLALMIPLFGIGVVPAIVALFLYALLPILRNTAIGLFSVDPLLKKVATGMGLTQWQRLRYVEVPLAMPTIFAGIKTAAVINIGTATLAAFIGAGGLGEFIVTGLALNNTDIILRGAIPAALLAILVEFVFEVLEKVYVPKHLQQKLSR